MKRLEVSLLRARWCLGNLCSGFSRSPYFLELQKQFSVAQDARKAVEDEKYKLVIARDAVVAAQL